MNPPPMERQVAPTTVPPFVPRVLRRAGIGEESVPGRRSKAYSAQGATVRAVRGGRGINMVGTVLAAADRGARIVGDLIDFQPDDLRGSLRRGMESNLIVFLVDSSGSMAGRDRLSAVTGAVTSMLRDAYQRRDFSRAGSPAHRIHRRGYTPSRRSAHRRAHPTRRGVAHGP